MNPLSYFLNPVFFFTLLFIISGAFILAIRLISVPDKKSEETLEKLIPDVKEELEKELKSAQEEIERLNAELALKIQMFEGLKGQYNELEKDYEKLAQKAPESSQDTHPPKNTPLEPQQQSIQTIKPALDKTTDPPTKT